MKIIRKTRVAGLREGQPKEFFLTASLIAFLNRVSEGIAMALPTRMPAPLPVRVRR